jgi:hypothetical protein
MIPKAKRAKTMMPGNCCALPSEEARKNLKAIDKIISEEFH